MDFANLCLMRHVKPIGVLSPCVKPNVKMLLNSGFTKPELIGTTLFDLRTQTQIKISEANLENEISISAFVLCALLAACTAPSGGTIFALSAGFCFFKKSTSVGAKLRKLHGKLDTAQACMYDWAKMSGDPDFDELVEE